MYLYLCIYISTYICKCIITHLKIWQALGWPAVYASTAGLPGCAAPIADRTCQHCQQCLSAMSAFCIACQQYQRYAIRPPTADDEEELTCSSLLKTTVCHKLKRSGLVAQVLGLKGRLGP